MGTMEVRVTGAEAIALALDPDAMRRNVEAAMNAIVLEAASFLAEASPEGEFSNLASAWGKGKGVEWQGDVMIGFMDPTPAAPYAWPVIYGRKPGKMPPPAEILPWVRYKLGLQGKELISASFLIARAIGRRGTRPNPFPQAVVDQYGQRWADILAGRAVGEAEALK